MIAVADRLRRGLNWLRRSMTAHISVATTLVSVLIVSIFIGVYGRLVNDELRKENERTLLANLAFIRDDLSAVDFDLSQAPRLVNDSARRTRRLHAAIVDGEGQVAAASPGYDVPSAVLMRQPLVDAAALPMLSSMDGIDALRERFSSSTSTWHSPDSTEYRLLTGRIRLPAREAKPASTILVSLAINTIDTQEVHRVFRRNLLVALGVATLLAAVLGVWVARRIVFSARFLSAAASRISAQALDERLSVDKAPIELLESALAFNRMLDRLQGAFERLSAFSSELAHDLRTPLSNLLGEAQVALSRPRGACEYRAVLESAVEEYERLSRMIGNMLFLARADNEHPAIACRWLELGPALDRVVGYFEVLAEERGVSIEKTLDLTGGAAPGVWADETMLTRAVSNLVSNALRYATIGTSIEIAGRVEARAGCTIEVSNEGPAISADDQARVFERFYRADACRHASASSSGLGLAIVRSIMKLHGGDAWVHSGEAERTVFGLRFPAAPWAALEAK